MRKAIKLPLFIISFLLLIIFISFSISEIRLSSIEGKPKVNDEKLEQTYSKINEIYPPNQDGDLTSNKSINFDKPSENEVVWARESIFLKANEESISLKLPMYDDIINKFYKKNQSREGDYYKLIVNTKNLSYSNDTVLIIGDSFVGGHGIFDDNTNWPLIFSDKINSITKGKQFNIISVGEGGWDIYDYIHYADKLYNLFKYKYLIISFLPNDHMNYNISVLKQKNSNINDGYKYIKCMTGDLIMIKFLSIFDNLFPRTVKESVKLYCSKYLKLSDDQIEVFEKTLYNLKIDSEINNYKVIFMPLYPSLDVDIYMTNPNLIPDSKGNNYLTEIIRKVGFDIVSPDTSIKIASKKDKYGWVNPIDWHPSVILSHAYANDLFNYFDRNSFLISAYNDTLNTYKFSEKLGIYNYFSSIKPFDFFFKFTKFSDDKSKKYININNLGISDGMLATRKSYRNLTDDPNSKLTGKDFPPQSSLCAKINRPHAEISFNKDHFNNFEVKIINDHPANQIIVGSKSYDLYGNEYYSRGYILKPNEDVKLVINGTLIIASLESGCPVDKPIKLPELDITLEI